MRYASVCSGIEAATSAWEPLGWEPVWFSQYDPEHNYKTQGPDFPSRVLEHHYPHISNLGDMLKLRDKDEYKTSEFDLLVGGTPCQAFSIAGLRTGLGDERSNLALEYIRILGEKCPGWFVWENVPGVLSSNGGSDFACILSGFTGRDIAPQKFEKAGIIQGDFYSVAWRVLDSRYFGVPQRRRRVFVVGHLGKDWRPPVAVLFERDSLRRDFTPGGKKRKGTAGDTAKGTGGDSARGGLINCLPEGITGTVSCKWSKGTGGPAGDEHYNLVCTPTSDTSPCLTRQLSEQSGQDLSQPGALVAGTGVAPIVMDRASFNQGENALYDPVIEETETGPPRYSERAVRSVSIDCRNHRVNPEISGTLQAKTTGGQSLNFINPVAY